MEAETESGTGAECLVRYGLAGRVGWFAAVAGGAVPGRGETVVLRSSRGLELGEVLKVEPSRGRAGEDSVGVFQVLRPADPADRELAHEALRLRDERFEPCRRIIEQEDWPLELVDVEPLLDFSTVLHVLPLGEFDPALVRARFRMTRDFDVHLETPDDAAEPDSRPRPSRRGGCGTGCASGCSSCDVAALLATARTRPGG